MKQLRYIFLSLLPMCFLSVEAQISKSKPNYNTDIEFHFGPAIFQGDVPSGIILSNKKLSDSKFGNSNINLGVGLNHRFNTRWAVKTNLNFLQLCGDDAWGKYPERNLKFRTFSTDISLLLECALVRWEYSNALNYRHNIFLSSGLAFFYYNPMGQYDNKWYSLRQTGTEGQGLKPGSSPYSRVSYSLPFNIGYRCRLNRRDVWGLEFCFRKTFTDYVDDVSTSYYDNAVIAENKGEAAAYLADPSAHKRASGTGRGNPSKGDNYSFFNITYARWIGAPYVKLYTGRMW